MEKTVQDLIDNEYRDYSQYVIKSRALPSNVDGLKPVQRKILFSMLKQPGKKKVAEIGGNLASVANYHHGEASGQVSAVKMAREWSNNISLLKGHGNFGSVLIQEAAAPRYIFAELAPIAHHIFKDTDLAPVALDIEDPEPEHYLPIIPFALVNGISGVAVGFATNILPRDPVGLAKQCRALLANPNAKVALEVKYPQFSGTLATLPDGRTQICGTITPEKYGFHITECPVGYDREKIIGILEKMIDDDLIKDYDDFCTKGAFDLKVKCSPVQKKAILDKRDGALGAFKLMTTASENIVMVDHLTEQRAFVYQTSDVADYVRRFVAYRLGFYAKRIEKMIDEARARLIYAKEKREWVVILRGKKDLSILKRKTAQLIQDLELIYVFRNAARLAELPFSSLTEESLIEIDKDIIRCEDQLALTLKLEPKALYDSDLTTLIKELQKATPK